MDFISLRVFLTNLVLLTICEAQRHISFLHFCPNRDILNSVNNDNGTKVDMLYMNGIIVHMMVRAIVQKCLIKKPETNINASKMIVRLTQREGQGD